jgi:O-Antigen ligase/Tetratricopeptide repeat
MTRSPQPADLFRIDPFSVISISALGLYFARFFLPAESAHLGETLWIVQLWLFLATFACLLKWRFGEPFRFDLRDVAVWTLVAGHVLGALIVIGTVGQKRAATNMLWEWVGVGIAFSMLKETAIQPGGLRKLLAGLVITLTVLSGLGLWQHFVWYPRERQLLLEFEQSPAGSARHADLAEELGPLASAADPTAAFVLRQRLLASTEPIGRFALANTLGGLLAVGLVLLCATLADVLHSKRLAWSTVCLALATILVTVCLLLTKSRTAWIGLLVGLAVWAGLRFGRRGLPRKALLIAGGLLALMIVAVTAAGGLDRLVVTEAPKSLRYRIEYWTGTWGVIKESPIFGVGPGNFRQHYLRYKLPESSEEVLDPHNLFLEVWVNGGIPGLIGLFLILYCGLRGVLQRTRAPDADDVNAGSTFDGTLIGGGFIAILLLLSYGVVLGSGVDRQLVILAGAAIVVGLAFRWTGVEAGTGIAVTFGAAVALLVHLLGQGGISMPVVCTTLLLILLRATTKNYGDRGRTAGPASTLITGLATVLTAVMAGTCLFTATKPVIVARAYFDLGEYEATQGDLQAARQHFQRATEADPIDPEPWQALGELDLMQWQREATPAEADFQRGMECLQQALSRDPLHAKLFGTLGQWEALRFHRTRDREAAEQAVRWFQQARERYPQSARLRADYALALAAAGRSQAARAEAVKALELDQLDEQLGHYDKVLDDDTRARLRAF